MHLKHKIGLALVFLFALSLSKPLRAQLTTGAILGTVTDPSGAAIPGAKVTVTNTGTQVARTATTAQNGDYVFNLLLPGTYSVTVTASGFKVFTASGIALAAGDRHRVDAKLVVGAVSQTVTVQAQSSALQTDSSVVSSTITQNAVQNIPLNGRNFVQLIQVQPGINQGPPHSLTNGSRLLDRRQTSAFSANGQGDIQNNAMIDGADNNTRGTQDIPVRPALDAIAEIHVETNDYPADVGRTGGAVVNVITKSGTNQFHGDMFEYLRNDITDANSYSFGASLPKSKLRWNQFGGSLGGPIVKNKAFFFGAYEGYRLRESKAPSIHTVPTLYEEQHPGDFSDVGGPVICTSPGVPVGCSGSIDPAGLAYFKMYPAPNHGTNQYYAVPGENQNSDDFDLRADEQLNASNSGFVRFIYNKATTTLPSGFPNVSVAGKSFDPLGDRGSDLDYDAMLSYTHIFSPNMLMRLAASYTRSDNEDVALSSGVNPNTAFGQPNINIGANSGLARIGVIGGAPLGNSNFIPVKHRENTFQYFGSLDYTHGSQSIEAGASLIRRQVNTVQSSFPEGVWTFVGYPNLVQGIYRTTRRSLDLYPPNFRLWEIGEYVQDDWRATRKLTFNLGLRYDIYTPYCARHNHASTFDPATGALLVAGQNGVSCTAGVKTDFGGVEPRLGAAFNLGNGLVIRGGFGISYFPDNTASVADLKNPPFTVSLSSCGVMASSPVKCPAGMTRFADGFLPPTPTSPSSPGFTIPDATDPNYQTSHVDEFNLTVQKEAWGNVLTVSYVGLLGRQLQETIPDLNAPPPNTASGAAFQELRPYYSMVPNLGTVGMIRTGGISNYNALQLGYDRRFSRGVAFQVNYTYAQNLTDAISTSTGTSGGYGQVPSLIRTRDYGNSAIAVRDAISGTVSYALPFGRGTRGLEAGVIKGWQMNLIGVWSTSNPFTVMNPINVSNTVPGAGDRVNVIADPNLSNKSINAFFNPAAFASQARGTLGNEGIMQYFGPSFRHLDIGLTKEFSLTERLKLDFTAQSFNLFNTPNFANPNSTLPAVTAPNTPTVTLSNISNTHVNPNHFGKITGMLYGYTPRVFQFAIKLHF